MCTLVFAAALSTIASTWKFKCPSTDDWIKKMWCVCIFIYNAILLSRKKEILPSVAMWMDLESVTFSGINQRQILYDTTYLWNIKISQMNAYAK